MRFGTFALMVGVAMAGVAVFGVPTPSGAQVVTTACTSTTATFIQSVGPSAAPVLVPMNLPVTECALPHKVQVIIPAFQVVGRPPATIIVPSGLPRAACASNVVIVSSAGSTSQVLTVSGSPVTVLSPATVVALPATCF